MDLIERDVQGGNRHPWELSRAECIISVFDKYAKALIVGGAAPANREHRSGGPLL